MHHPDTAAALDRLSAFRSEFYACLTRRADAVFDLTDAVLCVDGPVRSLVEASLAGEHRRGHGNAVNRRWVRERTGGAADGAVSAVEAEPFSVAVSA